MTDKRIVTVDYLEEYTKGLNIPSVDQTYTPESENAQSGKAVAQAVSSRVPKKSANPGAPFSSVIATSNGSYDEDGIPTDDSYMCINTVGAELGKDVNSNDVFIDSIPRRDSKGNLFTGTPVDNEDCANKKYVDEKMIVDQTYNSNSENAQSGKAVAQVINSRIPKVEESDVENYPKAVVSISDLEMINGKLYPKDTAYKHLNIDDGYSKTFPTTSDVSLTKGFIATRDSTTGNLWTGAPIDDVDCANKKYVDDKIAEIPSGGGAVDDVQINGESTVTDGVANIPIATNTIYGETPKLGVVGVRNSTYGINITTDGLLQIRNINNENINQRNSWSWRYYNALTLDKIDYAVKAAMCDGQGAEWTEEEKTSARDRMGIDKWEVISDTTTEFNTPVSQIVINQDTNGNSFSLKKMKVFIDFTVSEAYTGIARAITASSGLMYILSQSFSAGTVYGYFIDSEVLPMVNNRCQIISHFNENRMSELGNNFNFEYNSGAVDYAIRTEKMTVTKLGYNVSSISNLDFRLGSTGKINKARILIFGVRV